MIELPTTQPRMMLAPMTVQITHSEEADRPLRSRCEPNRWVVARGLVIVCRMRFNESNQSTDQACARAASTASPHLGAATKPFGSPLTCSCTRAFARFSSGARSPNARLPQLVCTVSGPAVMVIASVVPIDLLAIERCNGGTLWRNGKMRGLLVQAGAEQPD